MAQSHILAIDIGTQSVRAAIIDETGSIVFQESLGLSINRPQSTYAEQDPAEILTNTKQVIAAALDYNSEIKSAALAIQRSTVVAWNQTTGEPLSAALSWQDARAADQVEALKKNTPEIKKRSGLMPSPYYGASKICWLLNHDSAVIDAYSNYSINIGPLVSFVLFNLLQDHSFYCDESNAARTQLWNIHQRRWDEYLCEIFNVPIALLPEVKPTHCHYGNLAGTDIPLNVVCGDQNAAYFGVGEIPDQAALINLGSGAFILTRAGETPACYPALLDTLAISTEDEMLFLVEATINGAGAALKWASKEWNIDLNFKELELFLQKKNDLPVFINTVGGLGSPWWIAGAAPLMLSKQLNCNENPLTCFAAIIESIVFMLNYNLVTIQNNGIIIQHCVLSGGLSKLNSLCQILANLSGIQILRSSESEATVLGLAQLSNHLQAKPLQISHRFSAKADPQLHIRYETFCNKVAEQINASYDQTYATTLNEPK